jgi:hypothetical protein
MQGIGPRTSRMLHPRYNNAILGLCLSKIYTRDLKHPNKKSYYKTNEPRASCIWHLILNKKTTRNKKAKKRCYLRIKVFL